MSETIGVCLYVKVCRLPPGLQLEEGVRRRRKARMSPTIARVKPHQLWAAAAAAGF